MALTMIMDRALLVYSLVEKELRQPSRRLESLPKQKRKPTRHALDLSAHGRHPLDSRPGRSQGDILGEKGAKKDFLLPPSRGQGRPKSGVRK